MTFHDAKIAISDNFAARQGYIMSEPVEIRETIRWVEFVRAVNDVCGDNCGSGVVHTYARVLGEE